MKDCLVLFSSGHFNSKLLTVIDSAIDHWRGEYLVYSPDHDLPEYRGIQIHKGWPKNSFTHSEMPYQFKIALIKQALDMGHERIVWLDTSMRLNKDITPLFGETGIGVVHNLGHDLKNYISNEAVELLGVTDLDIPQIWGGALFFDFTKENCRHVFNQIVHHSKDGSFRNGSSTREGFIAHRHDQAVISVLVHGKCDMYPYGKLASAEHAKTKEYGDDIYLIYG